MRTKQETRGASGVDAYLKAELESQDDFREHVLWGTGSCEMKSTP